MSVIDCHTHLPAAGIESLFRRADAAGIERMCLFALGNEADPHSKPSTPHWPPTGAPHHTDACSPPKERMTASNDVIMTLLEKYPDRLYGLCFVNPRLGADALDEILRCVRDGPMLGIKLWMACRASDPLVEPVAALAVKLHVPILQHCWNKYGVPQESESSTRDVAALATKFPDLKIIAPHLSGHHEDGVLDLAPHPNVWVDTSGGMPDAGILDYALEVLGAERLLFGSDAPIRHPGSALARVTNCAMGEDEREAILGGNFRRLFNV